MDWESPASSKTRDEADLFWSRLVHPSELQRDEAVSQHFSQTAAFTTAEQDQSIATAIGKAIRHANRVGRREHIKADRMERVQHFCTSLRREISYIMERYSIQSGHSSDPFRLSSETKNWLIHALCEKGMWYDIGVTSGVYFAGSYLTAEKLNNWLKMVERDSYKADAQSDIILADLEELERGLTPIKQQIAEAERINREGDILCGQLCEVFN